MSQKAPANCQKWLQLGRDRGDKNNHVPLWKRPICTPGCAFGNYFRLCDVNTRNTVVWFNHTTEPHCHAARAPQTFCTRSHHLCTCAPRCPKCNRLLDSLGAGPGESQLKGRTGQLKRSPDCAGESRTVIFFGSHVQDIKMKHVNALLNGEFNHWPESIAMLLMSVDYVEMFKSPETFKQCGSLELQCKKKNNEKKTNSLVPSGSGI